MAVSQFAGTALRVWVGAFVAAFLLGAPLATSAQEQAPANAYVIPRMPLSEALARLGRQSGFHVNYDETLVHGLMSHPAQAASPHEALDQLLEGTGLAPRFTRRDAFTLVRPAPAGRPDMKLDDLVITAPVIGQAKAGDYAWYGSLLLQECFQKLRGQDGLAGRKYELQIYVWLNAGGEVTRLEIAGPPGQEDVRLLIESALTGLRLNHLPPQAMPQPIRLRITAM